MAGFAGRLRCAADGGQHQLVDVDLIDHDDCSDHNDDHDDHNRADHHDGAGRR